MKKFATSIEINSDPQTVWNALISVADWPKWDRYCEKIEGQIKLKHTVKAYSKLSPGKAFPVKVTVLNPNSEMVWEGGMPLGLFKGTRKFLLKQIGNKTRFEMTEEFNGMLAPLITKSIPDLSPAFQSFSEGLKAQCEAKK